MTNSITREEFASAVAATISSIHHLYREVDRLITGISDRLLEEPDPLKLYGGAFRKAGRDQTRRMIRDEYSALFVPAMGNDEDGDDEEDEEEEPEEGDEAEEEDLITKKKRTPPQIRGDESLLAVRIVMYDAQKRELLEPQIQYAVMNLWTVGNKAWDPKDVYVLRWGVLRKIPKALNAPNLVEGSPLKTKAAVKSIPGVKKADGRQLSCVLPKGVGTLPLYNLDTAEALDKLCQDMKLMWQAAVKPGS